MEPPSGPPAFVPAASCRRGGLVVAAVLAGLVSVLVPSADSAGSAPGGPSGVGPPSQQRPAPPLPGPDEDRQGSRVPAGLHELVLWDDLEAARTFYERVDPMGIGTSSVTPEPPGSPAGRSIEELALSLDDAWSAPFEFVRRRIGYLPYAGRVRGGGGTLRSGMGNSVDQALLLRDLLRARGVEARLVRGRLSADQAARLLGDAEGSSDADPVLVQALSAEHWWIEAKRDEDWVALDPSFPGARPGRVHARGGRPVDRVPVELRASVRIDVGLGTSRLGGVELELPQVVGTAASIWLEPWRTGGVRRGPEADTEREVAVASGSVDRPGSEGRPSRMRREDGPWRIVLDVAGERVEAGPLAAAELPGLVVTASIRAPHAAEPRLEFPWGGRPGTRLVIAVDVAGGIARGTAPGRRLRTAAARLAEAEEEAYRRLRPPIAYAEAVRSLRRAAMEAWTTFDEEGPEAIARALLRTVDRLAGGGVRGPVRANGVRLAAVRWDPPEESAPGGLLVRLVDPVSTGGDEVRTSAEQRQFGYGVVRSAALSQLLHKISGAQARTAFDATLRAAGVGTELGWWQGEQRVPRSWPARARAEALDDLRRGFAVVGLQRPLDIGGGELAGWWRIAPAGGETTGWVVDQGVRVSGGVPMANGWTPESLDALLGTVRTLHRAMPLLAGLDVDGVGNLGEIPRSACAAADLAIDVLTETVPVGRYPPTVAGLCGVSPVAPGGDGVDASGEAVDGPGTPEGP